MQGYMKMIKSDRKNICNKCFPSQLSIHQNILKKIPGLIIKKQN